METFDKLIQIMAQLRSPNGCPWDIKQTHKSLKPYLIEEAHEVLEAIDGQDPSKLKEELGDLLLHVVFHAQIAKDESNFDINEVIEAIIGKLIERHPHVFGEMAQKLSAEQVLANWENIKAETSKEKDYYVLKGIPASMPALLKAYRIQEKVARFGFDWSQPIDILDKLEEERLELKEAMVGADGEKLEEELGDLLFTIVNLCRHYKIEPEAALNSTCNKFRARFKLMEDYLREDQIRLGSIEIKELDEYWEKAKTYLKKVDGNKT
ncbi:MAG: nucleoside triphosphate pyrophosphohydrolase [candidate division Zixibacteria bacterium CG_4_9_14_3_um_filter_46_8]|nr:MAG: nucleoside triphosphate pyrophosphohydrolase [candidate division Zixibacteria bacterium CG_4_9_14_3_um_filter_46_8]